MTRSADGTSEAPGEPRSSARRRRLLAGIVAAGTLGVCLALLLAFFSIRAWRDPYRRTDVVLEGDWLFDRDEEIGFVAARDSATVLRNKNTGLVYHVYTDGRRARVEAPHHAAPDRADLVTIGCSFTWGHGVEAAETYLYRLKDRLGVSGENLAMASYSGLNATQILERNLDLRPKVIVYGFIESHLSRNLSPCAPSLSPYCLPVSFVGFDGQRRPVPMRPDLSHFSPETYRGYYRDVLRQGPTLTLGDVLWRMRADLLDYRETRRVEFPSDPASQRLAARLVLERMVLAARRAGARLVVVDIPYVRRGDDTAPPRPLLEALAGLDLTFVDLGPAIKAHYARAGSVDLNLPEDGHPSALAHELIAGALEPVLAPMLGRPVSRPEQPPQESVPP